MIVIELLPLPPCPRPRLHHHHPIIILTIVIMYRILFHHRTIKWKIMLVNISLQILQAGEKRKESINYIFLKAHGKVQQRMQKSISYIKLCYIYLLFSGSAIILLFSNIIFLNHSTFAYLHEYISSCILTSSSSSLSYNRFYSLPLLQSLAWVETTTHKLRHPFDFILHLSLYFVINNRKHVFRWL